MINFKKDPIEHVEKVTKEVHENIGKYTKPVLRRYPLLFSFLVVFSVAAILHGFELFADQINLFTDHPIVLIIIGAAALFLTGTLYKALQNNS